MMLKERYLLLMRDVLMGINNYEEVEQIPVKNNLLKAVNVLLRNAGLEIYRNKKIPLEGVEDGYSWVRNSLTMIGIRRLNFLSGCIGDIIIGGIKGDLIECGVWRGGASIFMKAVLCAWNEERVLWLADSFNGLPKPDSKYAADLGDIHYKDKSLVVSKGEVEKNFLDYYLLDENVKFLEGWFKDTLPNAPIEKLALLRIDADMYEGTMDCLVNLYHKVSEGGFVIVDDYALPGCRKAVDDFREKNKITSPIIKIDWTGIYWRK